VNLNNPKVLGSFLVVLAFFIFITPALWNGFPLIFTDSLSYLTSGVDIVAPVDRPIFYGLFIRTFNIIFDLWGAVLIQAVLVMYLLLKLSDILFPKIPKIYSIFWLILVGLLTSASWFISQLSADIFTACLFLSMIILALTSSHQSLLNDLFMSALLILEVCMHSGNLIIGFLLFAFILVFMLIQKRAWRDIQRFSILVIASLAISATMIVASNVLFKQGFTLNRWGKIIFLARILEDGPGLQYLNEVCPEQNLKICAALPLFNEAVKQEFALGLRDDPELKNLVLNALLWDGGINIGGGLYAMNKEATPIILGVMKAYPLQMALAFTKNTIDQFKTFSVGNQFGSTAKLVAINTFFESNFPSMFQSYQDSKQYSDRVRLVTNALNPIYSSVIYLSLGIAVASLFVFRYRNRQNMNFLASPLCLVIFGLVGFLVFNALITGGISAVFGRYQSRVIWLLPAIILLIMLGAISNRHQEFNNRLNGVVH